MILLHISHLIQPVIGISSAGVVDEQKGEIVYAGPTIPNYKGSPFCSSTTPADEIPMTG
jgi:hypothetical protein